MLPYGTAGGIQCGGVAGTRGCRIRYVSCCLLVGHSIAGQAAVTVTAAEPSNAAAAISNTYAPPRHGTSGNTPTNKRIQEAVQIAVRRERVGCTVMFAGEGRQPKAFHSRHTTTGREDTLSFATRNTMLSPETLIIVAVSYPLTLYTSCYILIEHSLFHGQIQLTRFFMSNRTRTAMTLPKMLPNSILRYAIGE